MRRTLTWLSAVTVLTGAGLTSWIYAAAASPAAGGALCAVTGQVDGLAISRVEYLHNGETFTFPAHITVTEARQAQAVARALCALPTMPAVVFCPADWGLDYRLIFTASDSKLAPVTVDATGCRTVGGIGPGRARYIPGSSPFWRLLGVAAGVTPADQATFAGATAS